MARPELSYVKELLHYNADTGEFTWRHRLRRHFKTNRHYHSWNARYGGNIAGAKTPTGYVQIKINGGVELAHRLAWLYDYGAWPVLDIDHVNRVKDDNRIANLRLATESQNAANSKRRKANLCGYKGVSLSKDGRRYRARIRLKGVEKVIGYFSNAKDASEAYAFAAAQAHGEFFSGGDSMAD